MALTQAMPPPAASTSACSQKSARSNMKPQPDGPAAGAEMWVKEKARTSESAAATTTAVTILAVLSCARTLRTNSGLENITLLLLWRGVRTALRANRFFLRRYRWRHRPGRLHGLARRGRRPNREK